MFQKDDSNIIFQLAVDLVNDTSQHIFLTGKAGTGKTTFLKYIREHCEKNAVVVAPTGVAAINAGGVTMHSFFQLPRGLFLPGHVSRDRLNGLTEITDKHSLFRNIHFSADKRQLIQEMELLIIDEVSMVRCDMLDAMDTVLRHFRRAPHIPFGGVQVVYIGDLYQLPPVVSNEEWPILQEYYQSPFFFSAHAVKDAPPVQIELKKIYRQNEQQFIEVLNRIRNNILERKDFDFLNSRYDAQFEPPKNDHYITITTHNKKADAINRTELEKLPGKMFAFKAIVKDEFSDKALPTDFELQLKPGAQVMFIKNDSSPERRFFNGKIVTVKKIRQDEIVVSLNDDSEDLVLEKETWKNIRYTYNKEKDHIDEEELGSFTQYPIRLAWAITVHKSQGLTFEKAIIDAGASFAAGQVYVALSRCVSMEGIVLKSMIHPFAVSTDKRIVEFSQREVDDPGVLEAMVEKEKYRHRANLLVKLFDWGKVLAALYQWTQIIPGKKIPDTKEAMQLAQSLLTRAKEQSATAEKFQRQLNQILLQVVETKETALLQDRMSKAILFFAKDLTEHILQPIREHLDALQYVSRASKYREEVRSMEAVIWQQVQKMCSSRWGSLQFADPDAFSQFDPMFQRKTKAEKKSRGSSRDTSYALFRSGKTIDEIARIRNVVVSTVEGHLSAFVRTGIVAAEELVKPEKIEAINKVINQVGAESAGLIKSKLDDSYSFHEIRVAMNHWYYTRQKQTA
jgi:hypothetical protein